MDSTQIITVVGSAVAALSTTIVRDFLVKKKTTAETTKLTAETDSIVVTTSIDLVKHLEKAIEEHERRIQGLRDEIDELKEQNKMHIQERERLSKRIAELEKENRELFINDKINKEKIVKYKEDIKQLKLKLSQYVDTE